MFRCDFISTILIVMEGTNPRLDGSLLGMLRVFERMFGDDLWKHAVILFSKVPMDKNNKRKRSKNGTLSDEEKGQSLHG